MEGASDGKTVCGVDRRKRKEKKVMMEKTETVNSKRPAAIGLRVVASSQPCQVARCKAEASLPHPG